MADSTRYYVTVEAYLSKSKQISCKQQQKSQEFGYNYQRMILLIFRVQKNIRHMHMQMHSPGEDCSARMCRIDRAYCTLDATETLKIEFLASLFCMDMDRFKAPWLGVQLPRQIEETSNLA